MLSKAESCLALSSWPDSPSVQTHGASTSSCLCLCTEIPSLGVDTVGNETLNVLHFSCPSIDFIQGVLYEIVLVPAHRCQLIFAPILVKRKQC